MRVCLKTKSVPTKIFSDECVSFNRQTAWKKPKYHPGLAFYFVLVLIILFCIYWTTTNRLAPKICPQYFPTPNCIFSIHVMWRWKKIIGYDSVFKSTSLFGWGATNTALAVGKIHGTFYNKATCEAQRHAEIEIIILWQDLHLRVACVLTWSVGLCIKLFLDL